MLRRLLEKLIVDYAGDYIQDFRRDQLKFTALKGEIFLQDLELRTDALLEVTSHLPLTVVGCRVDQLKIKIPWKKLKKEHVSVTCRGIYVVIAPQNLAEHGAPGETWSEVMRRQQLKAAELVRSQWEKLEPKEDEEEVELEEEVDTGRAKKIPFSKRLLGRVLDNMRVSLEDIVLQYEDCIYDPQNPHAFTVQIQNMDMFTTDATWAHTFVDRRSRKGKTQPILHRMLHLSGLSLSWRKDVTGLKMNAPLRANRLTPARSSQLSTSYASRGGGGMLRTKYVPPLEDTGSIDSESVTSEASNLTDLSSTSPTKRSFRKRMKKTMRKLGKRKKKGVSIEAVAQRHSLSPTKSRVSESMRPLGVGVEVITDDTSGDQEKTENSGQDARPQERWWTKLKASCASGGEYILSPLSVKSKVVQGRQANTRVNARVRSKAKSRHISVTSDLTQLRLSLNNVGYKDLAIFTERLTAHEAFVTQSAFQKLRPSLPPTVEPRAWWQYACKAITLTMNSGTLWTESTATKFTAATWRNTVRLLDKRSDYVLLWKQQIVFSSPKLLRLAQKASLSTSSTQDLSQHSQSPSPTNATSFASFAASDDIGLGPDGVQQALVALEAKLSLSQILLFRCLAEKELEMETKRLRDHKSSIVELKRSLASLKRSKGKGKKKDTWMLTLAEKQRLYEEVTSRFASLSVIPDASTSAMISQLRLELDLKLSLSQGVDLSLLQKSVLTGASQELIRLAVGTIEATTLWQQEESIEVLLSVDSVTCTDCYSGEASLLPTLLSHRTVDQDLKPSAALSPSSSQPFAQAQAQLKKLAKLSFSWRNGHKLRDIYTVSATAAPISVVLNPKLIRLLVDTFTVAELAYMAPKTLDRLRTFRQSTQERLQRRFFSSAPSDESPYVDVAVDWGAPELVIPASVAASDAVTAVVKFGRLAIHSTSCTSISATNPDYDLVCCALSGLAVSLTTLQSLHQPKPLPKQLVKPFGAVVNIWRKVKLHSTKPTGRPAAEVYSLGTPLSALFCVDGTIDSIEAVVELPDALDVLKLVEAFSMDTDELFSPKRIQRSMSLSALPVEDKGISRTRSRTETQAAAGKGSKGKAEQSGQRMEELPASTAVTAADFGKSRQLDLECQFSAPKVLIDLLLEPAVAVHRTKFEGWEWAWDQQTTDDRFPPGMLSACLEGTTVRFASCGEVSKVLVEAKSLAVEDRLQRASPAFFYFVGTVPSDQQCLLRMSLTCSRRQTQVDTSIGKLCVQWNHTTVSSFCQLLAAIDARVQAYASRLRRVKQLRREAQAEERLGAIGRQRLTRLGVTLEELYVVLNQETEGKHLGCVRLSGLDVGILHSGGKGPEVQVSLQDASVTDVSYTKPSISRMRMAPKLKGPLFLSRLEAATGPSTPFFRLSLVNSKEKDIATEAVFAVHDFRFLWAHTYTKELADYVADAVISPLFSAFQRSADLPVISPDAYSVVVEGEVVNAKVIIPAVRAGREYQYKEGQANDEASLEAMRVGFGVTVFTSPSLSQSAEVVSVIDPLPFATADATLRYGQPALEPAGPGSHVPEKENLAKQPPSTEIRMEFEEVQVFVTKADRQEEKTAVSNVFDGRLFWHVVDFTPAQHEALAASDCDFCATDVLLRKKVLARGGGPGTLFKPPAQRFSICVDVEEVRLDLSSVDILLFGYAFTENIRDWRRNIPVTPEPKLPLFSRSSSPSSSTQSLPVRFNGTELVASTARDPAGPDRVYAFSPPLDAASLAFDYERFFLGKSKPVVFLEVDVRVKRAEISLYGGDGRHSSAAASPLALLRIQHFEFLLGECQRRQQVMDIQLAALEVHGFDLEQRAHPLLLLDPAHSKGSTRCRKDLDIIRRSDGRPLHHEWTYASRPACFTLRLLKYSTGKEKRLDLAVGKMSVTPDPAVLSRMLPLVVDPEAVRRELDLPNFSGTGGASGARLMRSGLVVVAEAGLVEVAAVSDWSRPSATDALLLRTDVQVVFAQNRRGCIKVEAGGKASAWLRSFKEFTLQEREGLRLAVDEEAGVVDKAVAGTPTSMAEEDIREWLRAVYLTHKPEKVAEVEQILNMFGQEHANQLVKMVQEKYALQAGPIPAAQPRLPAAQQATQRGEPSPAPKVSRGELQRCWSESRLLEEVAIGVFYSLDKGDQDAVDTMVEVDRAEVLLGLAECEQIVELYNVFMSRWGLSEGLVEPSGVGSMVSQSSDFFVLVSNGFVVTLRNDYGVHPVPLLRLELANLTIKGQGVAEEDRRVETMEVKLFAAGDGRKDEEDASLSASYYNHQVMQWEPLLEPWSFTAALKRVHTTQAEQMSLNLVSFTMLNLNLSYALCESLSLLNASRRLNRTARLQQLGDRPAGLSSPAEYEYYVRNNTGMLLQVSSFGAGPMRVSRGSMQHVSLAPAAHRSITFAVEEDGLQWELQGTLPLSRYGVFVHSLFPVDPQTAGQPLKVLCKVALDYLGKVIVSIASPVCLRNRTCRSLSLLLTSRSSKIPPMLLEPFPPGSSMYIPLTRLDARIKFRPLRDRKASTRLKGREALHPSPSMMEAEAAAAAVELAEMSGYGWGDLADLCELHKKVDKRFVVSCRRLKALKYAGGGEVFLENGDKSTDTNKAAGMLNEFTCYYRVQAFNSANRPRIRETYEIEIEPPIKLQNRLPVPLYYRVLSVQQRQKKSLGNVPINGGEVPISEETEVFHHPYTLPTEEAAALTMNGSIEEEEEISSGELLLGICVPGTTWSQSWQPSEVFGSAYNGRVVNAPGNELVVRSYNHSVLVVYGDGNPLQINLESSRSAAGSIQVCAYVSAWLINRTRLHLKFRASGENILDEIGYRFRDLTSRRESFSLEEGPDAEDTTEVVMFSEASSLSINMRASSASPAASSTIQSPDHTKWSAPINLAAVGTRSDISCEVDTLSHPNAASKQRYYHVAAMAVSLAPPPFARSKVVTFVPRFILVNCLPKTTIYLRQRSSKEAQRKRGAVLSAREKSREAAGQPNVIELSPGEGRNLEKVDGWAVAKSGGIDPMMVVSLPMQEGWDWSGGFRISSVDEQAVKVHNVCTGETKVLRIRIEADGATTVCRVSPESPTMPLYRVENESSELVHYYQLVSESRQALVDKLRLGVGSGLGLGAGRSDSEQLQDVREYKGVVERLFPRESRVFGWDEPCVEQAEGRAIVLAFEGDRVLQVVLIDVLETQSKPLKVELSHKTLLVSTRVDGITKCLVVYDEASSTALPPTLQQEKPFDGRTDTGNRILSPLGFLQHQLARRLQKRRGLQLQQPSIAAPPLCFQMRLCGASVSVVDRAPQEIALLTLKGVNVNYYRVLGEKEGEAGGKEEEEKSSSSGNVAGHETVEVSVHLFQVDNQLEGATFPVMVGPTSKWNSLKEPVALMDLADFHPSQTQRIDAGTQPACIQLSVVKRKGFSSDFDFLDFFSVMVQELDVKVEDTTLLLLYRLFWEVSNRFQHEQEVLQQTWEAHPSTSPEDSPSPSNRLATWLAAHKKRSVLYRLEDSNASLRRGDTRLDASEDEAEDAQDKDIPAFSRLFVGKSRKLYVQLLHLHPLSINLSFAFSAKDREMLLTHRNLETPIWSDAAILQKVEGFNPSILMSLLPPSLVDVEDAQIRLDAFVVPHLFAFRQQWIEAVGRHYFQQLVTQVYKVIGSIDMLGNPVGVFNYIGSGLSDFIMEPAKGMRESSVSAGLANGVVRGTASLVRNTLLGSFDAISKLSGALGTGVAYLSFDDRFVADRRTDFRDRRPRHIGTGLMLGAEALATNLYDGFGGIVFQPLQSIEDGKGFEGFVKGLGRGIVGIAVRPVVGVLDATARTASGIKSSAEALDSTLRKPLGRIRLPRMLYGSCRELRRFNEQDAFINELIVQVWKASHKAETREYLTHIAMDSTLVVVATSAHVSCIDYSHYTTHQLVNLISSRELLLWSIPLHKVSDVAFSLVSGKVRVSLHNAAGVHINQSAIRALSHSINTQISAAGAFLLQVSASGGGLQPMSPTEGRLEGKAEFMIPVDSSFRGEALSNKLRQVLKRRQAPSQRKRLGIVLANEDCPEGMLVESVVKGSLAEAAGISANDLLVGLSVGGNQVRFTSKKDAIVRMKKLMEDYTSGLSIAEVKLICKPESQREREVMHTLRFSQGSNGN